MKTRNKFTYKTTIVVFVLSLALLIGFCMSRYHYGNIDKFEYNSELSSYLYNNRSQNSDTIDKDKYEIFVTGEIHATQKNFEVQMNVIKNLSENADLKYIIAECGMADALVINDYLRTGDISKLNTVFEHSEGAFACNNEEYRFLQSLYEFNDELPDNKKLTYLGLDIEHQSVLALSYLQDIILMHSKSEKMEKILNVFNEYKDDNEIIACLENTYDDINRNSQPYSEILGKDFWVFRYLIRNILNTYKCCVVEKDDLQQDILRERLMAENFYEIYNHLPKGKYYGYWGLEHAYLSNVETDFYPEYVSRLATALNNSENSPVKNKVCSMMTIYFDSFNMDKDNGQQHDIDINNYINTNCSNNQNELDILKSLSQDDVQFFKLDSENSPFSKNLYLFDGVAKSGNTTDYFKNIVVVRNSLACTKFNH